MGEREPFRIDAPLALVSQIQRSGGSLLAELFDGHPQVYAHPLELRIWYPTKEDWPVFDLAADPLEWFDRLHNRKWAKLSRRGFAKPGRNPFASELRFPFTFSADEQRELFLRIVGTRPLESQRDVLNAYFSSFFTTWREWEPTGREQVITGFLPRIVMAPESLEHFLAAYPDGKLITILRDPFSWFASSSRHRKQYRDVAAAIDQWSECARAIAGVVESGADWAAGVLFADLVSEPEPVMRRLAAFVGIDFQASLMQPTYLGRPMLPNSSFAVRDYGINAAMAHRRDQLDPDALDYIEREAAPLYEEVAALLGAAAARVPAS